MLKTNESRRTAMGAAIVAALVIASVILYLRLGKPMIALVRDPARLRAWVDGLGWKSRIVYGAMVCFQVVVAIIPGEPLELAAGSELVPRAGTVTASASLADVTSGAETAAGAALEQNHLYAASATCRLYAEGSVTLLLRGSFSRS